MSAPIVAFLNSKGGVGKTSLVWNLGWMLADLGVKVLAVDLDPQANLTSLAISEEELDRLWVEGGRPSTIYHSLVPILENRGDVEIPDVISIGDGIGLVPGDLALSSAEDELSRAWTECMTTRSRALEVTTALATALRGAADRFKAEIVFVDLPPTFGAVTRAALLAADHVAIPVVLDSMLPNNLKLLGKRLDEWRLAWKARRDLAPASSRAMLPDGAMRPLGYVVTRPQVYRGQLVRREALWMQQLPHLFHEAVLSESTSPEMRVDDDPYFLGLIKNYLSLMELAREAHKPVHHLRPADGALGAHQAARMAAWSDFAYVAHRIATRVGIALEEPPAPSTLGM